MIKRLLVVLFAIALVTFIVIAPAEAANPGNGAKIFTSVCSACHLGGNNLIIQHKTLKKEALEKYDMYSLDAIKRQVAKGKNAMPAFSGRLSEAQIEDVATYVLGQADKGW